MENMNRKTQKLAQKSGKKFENSTNIYNSQSNAPKSLKSARNSQNRPRPRIRKQCPQPCKKHEFQLKPIGYSSFLSRGLTQQIAVNFCSKGQSTTIPVPIIPSQLMKQPQVPLFILQNDIKKYQFYMQSHREQFRQAVSKAYKATSDQQEELPMPIPKTKNCQVCRVKIDKDQDYHKHLSSYGHRMEVNRSLGQKLIQQDTQIFREEKKVDEQIKFKMNQLRQIAKIFKQGKRTLKGLLLTK